MQIEMSPAQAQTHIAALRTHAKNQRRKLFQCDARIARAREDGDLSTAYHIEEGKAERLRYIGMTEDELYRMQELFEDRNA